MIVTYYGVCHAFIMPQMSTEPSLYKKYFTVIISFGVSLVTISSLSILFLPNWFELWIQRIQQYSVYVQAKPANLVQSVLSFANIPEKIILISLSLGILAIFTGWFFSVIKSRNFDSPIREIPEFVISQSDHHLHILSYAKDILKRSISNPYWHIYREQVPD